MKNLIIAFVLCVNIIYAQNPNPYNPKLQISKDMPKVDFDNKRVPKINTKKLNVKGLDYKIFKDPRDGENYEYLKIGRQVWMTQNMRYNLPNSYTNPHIPHRFYGRQYTFEEAKSVCPPGWHLPSDNEWDILVAHVQGQEPELVGRKLKSQTGWSTYGGAIGNGIDTYGFTALPSGFGGSTFLYTVGNLTVFMSSSNAPDSNGWNGCFWSRGLLNDSDKFERISNPKELRYSCRCVKD